VNTDKCDEVKDIFDESTNYIKTTCLVAISATYKEAQLNCLSYGMSLYVLDNSKTSTSLSDFSNTRFKASLGVKLYVSKEDGVEDCKVLYNGEGLFEFVSDSCDGSFFFYCQYNVKQGKTTSQKTEQKQSCLTKI
jgi:hypothetical protein